jgi:hypothetical protein
MEIRISFLILGVVAVESLLKWIGFMKIVFSVSGSER